MKRPPQFWLLPTLGILCIFLLPTVHGKRATSLIFAKSTTTTTEAPAEKEVVLTSNESPDANDTDAKPMLTGIPQIDWIWDPNLPRELNGFNLTDYPFYDVLPKNINFKCEGLHDGFYASVLYKCQVYHHCLYGTRYDFLCANFTAFDQRTFICQFVSEVDCVNSPNFWHRNDALYEPTTTTSTTTIAPVTVAAAPRRPLPGGRRRRPLRRRRPQYDYYYDDEVDEYDTHRDRDEYYDEPRYAATEPPRSDSKRRRKRPRPASRRPEYEYEEYEDERFDRRGSSRRDEDKRPYDRRPAKKDPRREDDVVEDRVRDDRRRPSDKTPERKPADDRRRPAEDDYDRRPYRKPSRRPAEEDRFADKEERRPAFDRPRKSEDDERRYRPKDTKDVDSKEDDRRTYDRPRKTDDDDRKYRPKETKPLEDDTRRYRPKDTKPIERERPSDEPKALVRPSSGSSVYDRPRAPPIIRRPVPKTERDKFDYKPVAVKPKQPEDEEYYDEYEDELPKSPAPKPTTKKPEVVDSLEGGRGSYRPRRPQSNSRRPVVEDVEEPRRPAPKRNAERSRYEADRSKKRVVDETFSDEDYEEEKPKVESPPARSNKYSVKERPTEAPKVEATTSTVREYSRHEPVVRVVKRPFLPSRGGNPYVSRGLQPVGAKALDIRDKPDLSDAPYKSIEPSSYQESKQDTSSSEQVKATSSEEYEEEMEEVKTLPLNKDDPTIEDIKPVTTRPRSDFRSFRSETPLKATSEPSRTPKPKLSESYRNPLDINENEYDVTLNDALNPTIPNLPIRSVPTGFGSGRDDGYVSQNYQRPRFVAIEAPLASASSDLVYQQQEPQGRLQEGSSNADYSTYVRAQPTSYQGRSVDQRQNYRHPSTAAGQYFTF